MLSEDTLTQFLQNVEELPFAKTDWCCFLLQSLQRCADISIHQPYDEDEQPQVEADSDGLEEDGCEGMEPQEAVDPDDMALEISPLPLPKNINGSAECGVQKEDHGVCRALFRLCN